jgi:uncharacterized membrane protein YgdD (TMEM256/DUF423 family)
MHKSYLASGAFFGAVAVGLGAFGAHGLQNITSDEKIIHGYMTGVEYQIYHSLALLLVGILYEKIPHRFIKWAGFCFIMGIILFSWSLLALTFMKIYEISGISIVGPVTPIGGLFLILGWLFIILGAVKKSSV